MSREDNIEKLKIELAEAQAALEVVENKLIAASDNRCLLGERLSLNDKIGVKKCELKDLGIDI